MCVRVLSLYVALCHCPANHCLRSVIREKASMKVGADCHKAVTDCVCWDALRNLILDDQFTSPQKIDIFMSRRSLRC